MARLHPDASVGERQKKLRLAAAIARRPQDFSFDPLPEETWTVLGQVYDRNPREVVPGDMRAVVHLWFHCRGGEFGGGPLPDTGGVNDQSAWLLDAFDILGAADAEMRREERRAGER